MSSRRGTPSGVDSPKTAPTWIKVLVGLHVVVTMIWAFPNPPAAIVDGRVKPRATQWLLLWNAKYLKSLSPLQAYLFSTGTWQYWDMFAPDPASVDWYCTAEVEYLDGTTRIVPYPRMADLPIPEKYVKERYRKYYERAHDDAKPRLWPSFAQRMAYLGYIGPNNPPVVVRLRRYALAVADPGKPQPTKYDSAIYYSYAVDQRWLKRAVSRP